MTSCFVNRPKRICQKNPPPRFSLGDAEAVSGGVILIDPSSEKDLSKDLSKDSKDDDVTPTEFNKFNEFNKFKIPSSPGLETLATEAVEERARSLSRSPSPVIPAGKSPGSVGEAVGSIPVEVEQKKRRGRPPGSGHKRKAIDESVDEDFEDLFCSQWASTSSSRKRKRMRRWRWRWRLRWKK
jgi:hypothetical protein